MFAFWKSHWSIAQISSLSKLTSPHQWPLIMCYPPQILSVPIQSQLALLRNSPNPATSAFPLKSLLPWQRETQWRRPAESTWGLFPVGCSCSWLFFSVHQFLVWILLEADIGIRTWEEMGDWDWPQGKQWESETQKRETNNKRELVSKLLWWDTGACPQPTNCRVHLGIVPGGPRKLGYLPINF